MIYITDHFWQAFVVMIVLDAIGFVLMMLDVKKKDWKG